MNYQNQYQPYMQNPYMNNIYNPVPQYQQSSIPGKIVSDYETIMANDVPMNGNISVFPKNDLSGIVVKYWNQNGTINSVKFEPKNDETNILSSDTIKTDLGALERLEKALEDISKRLDVIEKAISPNKRGNNYDKSYANNSDDE